MCQSAAARRAAMPRATLLLVMCALARATIIPDHPTFSDRLQKLYEKLEKFSPKTTEPPEKIEKLYENPERNSPTTQRIDKLYEKLDQLNSLTPDKYLSDDDEELLDALQEWGMLDDEVGAEKDLQGLKSDDGDYDDEELESEDDYAMDDGEDLETEDKEATTAKTVKFPTPSALNRLERLGTAFSALSAVSGETRADVVRSMPQLIEPEQSVVSAVDSIAATKERPRILDDTSLTRQAQVGVARAARAYLAAMVPRGKCLTPQPRWLPVRHMAPASDTLYRPTCVQLHRCAADTGCCHNEEHVCAPVEGHYVVIPLYLRKPEGLTVARMQFFNHTRCSCVSQETLQAVPRPPRRYRYRDQDNHDQDNHIQDNHIQESRQDKRTQNSPLEDRRAENQEEAAESTATANQSDWPTQEPRLDSETAAPPQLRRCTCPTLFLARAVDSSCVCICDWIDSQRRRDCISLSRGREHFGLRDRVCVANGDCNPPACEYGAYERNFGRCPVKRYRRMRFKPGKYLDRTLSGS